MNKLYEEGKYDALAVAYAQESVERMANHKAMVANAEPAVAAGMDAAEIAEFIEEERKIGMMVTIGGLLALQAWNNQHTILTLQAEIESLKATIAKMNANIAQATVVICENTANMAQIAGSIDKLNATMAVSDAQ